jgi:hypothetical protein
MSKEEKNAQFNAISSLFSSGSISRMKDIEKVFPTHVAKALGINHSRYIRKLYNPEEFTVKNLIEISKLLNLDVRLVWDVVYKQINEPLKSTKKK